MIVYKITNCLNGKVYIGQALTDKKGYFGSGTKIKNAVKSYGKQNFSKEILITCTTQEELDSYEELYIEMYSSTIDNCGYNILPGTANKFGAGNPMKIESVRLKMVGRKRSEKSIQKQVISCTGKKHKEETKAIQRLQKIGHKNPMFDIGLNHPKIKKVESYDPITGNTIQKYDAVFIAEKELNTSNISACIRGKQHTAGGYHWRYSV